MNSTQNARFKNKFKTYPNWDREEQIKRNNRALQKLEEMRLHRINMSDEEAKAREVFFEEFKQIVDNNRPVGAKLYSE
jgi:TRAP-type C4-dicarboxylate transport system substrate-binding protein